MKKRKLPDPDKRKYNVQEIFDNGVLFCDLMRDLEEAVEKSQKNDFDRTYQTLGEFCKRHAPTPTIEHLLRIKILYRKMYGKSPVDEWVNR